MAKPALTFLDYLAAAFHASPPIPGMGAVPVNKLALFAGFMLGFVNPGFWFIGAALEMVYLWMLSTDPRFQKYVQSLRINVVKQEQSEKLNFMMSQLDESSNRRLQGLNSNLGEIQRLMDLDDSTTSDFMKESKQQNLNQLSVLFLKLLFTKRVINESLQRTDLDKLKKEIKELTRQLESPNLSEAYTRSLKGNLEIQERRLENIKRAEENLQVVDMELQRIENQVQLIREEMAINRSPEAISSGIDRISSTMAEAEAFMNSHSEFFNRFSESTGTSPVPAAESAAATPPPPPAQPTTQG